MRIETVGATGTERASLSSGDPAVWRVGAIIDAVAQRDAGSGDLWLDTPYGRLPAALQSQDGTVPASGDTLQLRVISTSPTLELETVGSSRAEDALVNGLLRYLPRQASPMPLLANLGWLARGAASGNGLSSGPAYGLGDPLPPDVLAAASRLWNAIADSRTLSDPQQLAATIARSGQQLEANLINVPPDKASLQNDLKGLLLAFQQVLENAAAATPPGIFSTKGSGMAASAATTSGAARPGAVPGTDTFDMDMFEVAAGGAALGMDAPGGYSSAGNRPAAVSAGMGLPAMPANRAGFGRDASVGEGTPPPLAHAPLTPLSKLPATLTVLDSLHDQLAELTQQTAGSLARITVTQLSNAAAGGANAVWLVEVPVRHENRPDMVRLKFERERHARKDGTETESWSVEIALDLGAAGPMHARVSYDRQRINVHLRAASAALMQVLQEHSNTLAQGLRAAGLAVGGITCRGGMPGATGQEAGVRTLLDVRA